jgi:hypothetical protein
MHIWTHLQKKYQDMVAEKGLYGAGMAEVDDHVGVLLKSLMTLTSPTIRLSFSPPTTALRRLAGRTAA